MTEIRYCENCKHLSTDGFCGLICNVSGDNRKYDCSKYEKKERCVMSEKHYCESCHYFKSYSFDEMDCDAWCTKNPDDDTNNGVFRVLDPVECEDYKKKVIVNE